MGTPGEMAAASPRDTAGAVPLGGSSAAPLGGSSAAPLGQARYADAIASQPEALARVAAAAAEQLERSPWTQPPHRVLLTGMGASYAALAVPETMLVARGMRARRLLASDLPAYLPSLDGELVIAASQSGRSAETLDAIDALPAGHVRVAVCNMRGSALSSACGHEISLGDEPDSYASTIGFTGTIVALAGIAHALVGEDPAAEWASIASLAATHLASLGEFSASVADLAADVVAADVVAAGASQAAAENGSLLLREVARIPAAASVTRNYLHGEMESAGRTLHIVCGDGREIELASTLADAGHLTVLVTALDVPESDRLRVQRLPGETSPAVRTVLEAMVMQTIAGAIAEGRGVDVEEFVFHAADTKRDPAGAGSQLDSASVGG